MYLSKLILDPDHPRVRRDLASAYEMHRTLSRAFAPSADTRPHRFLWRVESMAHMGAHGAVVLVQSAEPGNWQTVIEDHGYVRELHRNKKVDLADLLQEGRSYHFRITANPTVTRAGKRHGLTQENEQLSWLTRQGERCGFRLREAVRRSCGRLATTQPNSGNRITLHAVHFDGVLEITDAEAFSQSLLAGIGHGKALGLGMLSIAPAGQ